MTRLTDARERRKFQVFVEEMFASAADDVPGHLAQLSVPDPCRLRMKVLYSRDTISAALAQQQKLGNVHERNPHAFRLNVSVGRAPSRKVRLPFAILDAGR